jgi:hypothetical protein
MIIIKIILHALIRVSVIPAKAGIQPAGLMPLRATVLSSLSNGNNNYMPIHDLPHA